MLELKDLPKTKDSKTKIRKSFNLTPEAVEIYEKAKISGIDSSGYIQNIIEDALFKIKHLIGGNNGRSK